MIIDKAFPSAYLKAADLEEREFTLFIKEMRLREVGDGEKPVIYFKETEKGLVLNKTNADEIKSAYGKETEEWPGKPVVLYCAKVSFSGRTVDGIRVRIPSPGTTEVTAQDNSDGDNNGTLPF